MKTTSIHSLNADPGLSLPGKFLWFFLNSVNNNLLPNTGMQGLPLRDFQAHPSDEGWDHTKADSTPSRTLCDLFWSQLPWQAIKSELGQIHILDTGCGSGRYGAILQSYSKGSIASYTGLDIHPHEDWKALRASNPTFQFQVADSANMSKYFPEDVNLIISQSAIEHFEQDLLYFEQVREFVRSKPRSVIQIHLFPSPACLRLYLLHGVRQYTPRTVSKAASLFQDFSHSRLYRLGGRNCNRLHWEYFTKPIFLRKAGVSQRMKAEEYGKRLRQAILDDNRSHRQPSFYALVIHSNPKSIVFD